MPQLGVIYYLRRRTYVGLCEQNTRYCTYLGAVRLGVRAHRYFIVAERTSSYELTVFVTLRQRILHSTVSVKCIRGTLVYTRRLGLLRFIP